MYKDLPKIELHCHLDGSLDVDTTREILSARGKDFTREELVDLMQVPEDCTSLAEYLKRFALPNEALQTQEDIRKSTKAFALNAAAENVKYLETRFAPQFSTAEGLSYRQVLESVEAGLRDAREATGIRTGIIVCGMRGIPMETNLDMLKAAREMLGAGVVACDLAGDEASYPATEFVEFFDMAKKYDMPYTIHAGECGSCKNIIDSIDMGAKRIGHGIAMMKDKTTMDYVISHHIGVEMCPTSNLQTKAVAGIEEYPFMKFFEAGVCLNLNTDNRTVSNVDLTGEFGLIDKLYGIGQDGFTQIYKNGVEMIFADDAVKHELLKSI